MSLRRLLAESGPWPSVLTATRIAHAVESRWKGARVFMTIKAARLRFRAEGRDPRGAAECLAADIEQAIHDCGGQRAHVDRILLACMTNWIHV